MTGVVTAVAVISAGASIYSSNKARKSQERASRIQQKIESRGAQRDRLSQLRQAQVARASAIQGAVTSGTADSSGLPGQLSGIQSTAASNLAFSQQTETGVGMINMYNRQAAKYQSQAATYGAISSLAMSAGPTVANALSKPTPKPTPNPGPPT